MNNPPVRLPSAHGIDLLTGKVHALMSLGLPGHGRSASNLPQLASD